MGGYYNLLQAGIQAVNFSKAWKIVLTLVLAAAVGFGSFWAVRTLRDDDGPGAGADVGVIITGEDEQKIFDEATRPRFVGEILGLYIAPDESLVPDQFKERQRIAIPPCSGSRLVPWDKASEFDAAKFNLSFQLSPSYVFDPTQSGLIVCNDDNTAKSARWHYNTQFNGFPGYLEILNTDIDIAYTTTIDVAVDRVKIITTGGRPAILIEPILPESGYTGGSVTFTEPGFTAIASANVPLSELLTVAEIIGNALTAAGR